MKAEEIDAVIGEYIYPSALLCTDTATNYKKFAKKKKLQHETVNERQIERVKKGIFHIQHVNNFYHRLKDWMERFQGVATKYLDNYLYWFHWLQLGKNLAFEKQVEQMLFFSLPKIKYNNCRNDKESKEKGPLKVPITFSFYLIVLLQLHRKSYLKPPTSQSSPFSIYYNNFKKSQLLKTTIFTKTAFTNKIIRSGNE